MEKSNTIIITIILGIIIFGLGVGLGLMMKKTQPCSPVSASSSCLLDSKAIGNWVASASGEVKEFSGKNLVLVSNGETLKIFIPDGAMIQKIVSPDKAPEIANLTDIQAGKKVEVQLAVSDNLIIGSLVTILP